MTNADEAAPLRAGELPGWAKRYLDEHLDKEVNVVNVHMVGSGPLKEELLLNTSEGSALLTKPRFGTPSLVRLPLPGRRFSFTCVDCKEQIELLDADMPRPFFCSRCARHYTLSREGDNYVLFTAMEDEAPAGKPRGPGWTRVDPASGEKPRQGRRQAVKRKSSSNRTARQKKKTVALKTPSKKKTVRRSGPPESKEPASAKKDTPYRYRGYILHTRNVNLKNGNNQRIYFFSKQNTRGATPSPKPDGYQVSVTATGLPVLRKSRNGSKESAGKKRAARNAPSKPRRKDPDYEPQCQALTEAGKQCRNSSRDRSKYCSSHFGDRPPRLAETTPRGTDTVPHVKGAEDTRPSHRRRRRGRK